MPKLTAGENDAGMRLDAFMAASLEDISRNRAQQLIESGAVVVCAGTGAKGVEAAVTAKNYRVSAGDVFEVELPAAEPTEILPEDIPLDIVYEDDDLIVINKRKGMVVHPAPGHYSGTLVNALLYHCGGSLSGIGGQLRPGIVHRLDKDTSGLMLAAKNDRAHACLSGQLGSRTLSRVYEAVIRGHLRDSSGAVSAPIGRHPTDRKKMAVTNIASRPASTRWEVICEYPGYTHVRCILDTGRTHQIRVHMSYLGHPVAGDTVYGGRAGELGLDSQCLHAKIGRAHV